MRKSKIKPLRIRMDSIVCKDCGGPVGLSQRCSCRWYFKSSNFLRREFKKALVGKSHKPLDGLVCLGTPRVRPLKPGETAEGIIRNDLSGGNNEKEKR